MNPKYTKTISIYASDEQFISAATQAMRDMEWEIRDIKSDSVMSHTHSWMDETGENITASKTNNTVIIESISLYPMASGERNQKHVERFEKIFLKFLSKTSDEKVAVTYTEIQDFSTKIEEKKIEAQYEFPEEPNTLSYIQPKKGFFVTPIIMAINILVFIVMVISGVHFMEPTSESLVDWGANFGPYTLGGDWWRLLTSNYLHIGVIHIAMNMYALLYIGTLLEPYLGKVRFITAYTITGILASITSTWWDSSLVSAGASGAIFGMYGVFLAMLSTNIVEKEARKNLLASIGIFVVYNLVFGLKGGVDNAAHIGGLLSGVLVGFTLVPSIKNEENQPLKYGTLLGLVILSAGIFYFVIGINTKEKVDVFSYQKAMEEFADHEQKAIANFPPEIVSSSSKDSVLSHLKTGISEWKKCDSIAQSINKMELNEDKMYENKKLQEYVKLRLSAYELFYKKYDEGTILYDAEINNKLISAESIITELNKINEVAE